MQLPVGAKRQDQRQARHVAHQVVHWLLVHALGDRGMGRVVDGREGGKTGCGHDREGQHRRHPALVGARIEDRSPDKQRAGGNGDGGDGDGGGLELV